MLFSDIRQNRNIHINCNILGYLQSIFWHQIQQIYEPWKQRHFVHLSVNLRKSRTQNNFCDHCLSLLCLLFEVSRWPLLQQADVVRVRQTVARMQCSTCEHVPASVCSQGRDSHGSNPFVSCFLGCQTPPAQNENSF